MERVKSAETRNKQPFSEPCRPLVGPLPAPRKRERRTKREERRDERREKTEYRSETKGGRQRSPNEAARAPIGKAAWSRKGLAPRRSREKGEERTNKNEERRGRREERRQKTEERSSAGDSNHEIQASPNHHGQEKRAERREKNK